MGLERTGEYDLAFLSDNSSRSISRAIRPDSLIFIGVLPLPILTALLRRWETLVPLFRRSASGLRGDKGRLLALPLSSRGVVCCWESEGDGWVGLKIPGVLNNSLCIGVITGVPLPERYGGYFSGADELITWGVFCNSTLLRFLHMAGSWTGISCSRLS